MSPRGSTSDTAPLKYPEERHASLQPEDHAGDREQDEVTDLQKERAVRLKVDLRLCTIAGILGSLDLLDSLIISNASVTSMLQDLDMFGNRYSTAVWIFAIANIAVQLPATIAVRTFGPRAWLAACTFAFGVITLSTAFVRNWQEMIVMRVLLGLAMSSIYPGTAYLLSTWYTRQELQLRFAYLQAGQVIILATGGIVNYGLNMLNGKLGLAGWTFKFLTPAETAIAVARINRDRGDVEPTPFTWHGVLIHARDLKIWGFACMLFIINLVTTALAYFLPIILQGNLGLSTNETILLSAPPYYYSVIPVILSSLVADRFRIRGPVIAFNSICLIVGFAMFGFAHPPAARYIGTFLATGAYVSNFAAIQAYYSSNIVGQWKRVFAAAVVTAFNRAGGVAGSYIIRQEEAPKYATGVWVSIGSHVVLIGFVGAFSAWFWYANGQQARAKRVIEGTAGFRHSY